MRLTSWPALGRGAAFDSTFRDGRRRICVPVVNCDGGRFGMYVPALAELNRLKPTVRLKLVQGLRINSPHIVPNSLNDGILINIPQRMRFYFKSGKLQAAYPVAVGRRTWPTPGGDFEVLENERDKTWIVPIPIQEELVAPEKPVREKVPSGPDNPLGRH